MAWKGLKEGLSLPLLVRENSFLLLTGYSMGLIRNSPLHLSAGIKEGLYDMQALAGYLLYRLTVLNPICKLSLKGIPEDKAQTPCFIFIWLC